VVALRAAANARNRINFSARCVITPLPSGHRISDIVLPYLTFMELFKFNILNVVSTVKGVSFSRANSIWSEATTAFSQEMHGVMQTLVKRTRGGLCVLLNRNPTIAPGSILLLDVVGAKTDYDDLTAGISNNILTLLGGDYDGDTLNIIPVFDDGLKGTFRVFDPKRMMLSPNNGRFNAACGPDRDQVLGLFSLNN
jgi:hypothetical protein